MGVEPFALWPVAAAVCLLGSAAAVGLERRLPEAVRRTPVRPTQTAAAVTE
jgi:hypothetical protein